MTIEIKTESEQQTELVGEKFALILKAGDIVALFGDLGVGKTAFIRGLARSIGYNGRVTSPTYTIVNEYIGNIPVFHFDMYRLGSSDELYDIGWEDYLEKGGICAIEWSERIEDVLADDCYRVYITSQGEQMRNIRIEGGRQ